MKLIKIDNGHALAALLGRRRAEFPPDCFASLMATIDPVLVAADLRRPTTWMYLITARGILRTASVLWRVEAKRTGDRDLYRAAKAAYDIAECKQVITAGEDL